MAPLSLLPAWVMAACIAAALALTLVLAAFLTPRHWWRRANVRALAVLAGGTALFAGVLMLGASAWFPRAVTPIAALPAAPVGAAFHTYHVFDDLNLRAASGTAAARIAVVPAGTAVTTTGRTAGDWWEVTARVGGHDVTGWASSLWLRRGDERTAHAAR